MVPGIDSSLSTHLSPMMRQYLTIKGQYPDTLLFFRLGDFYEMFFEDAEVGSRELGIVLTARDGGNSTRVPMCGIPHHAAEGYLARLVERGFRVAICEQVEDPRQTKGLVKRQVTRIISPGTVTSLDTLKTNQHNFLAAVAFDSSSIGLAYADLLTGDLFVTQLPADPGYASLKAELARIMPSECLLRETDRPFLAGVEPGCILTTLEEGPAIQPFPSELLPPDLAGAGGQPAERVLQLLYSYLAYCQQTAVSHLKPAQWYQGEDYLQLDPGTRQNLDLPALYSLLDFTQTSMGGRLLKAWVQQPLLGIEPIRLRQQAVTLLHRRSSLRHELRRLLRGILDLERLTGRISLGRCFPQDLLSLQASLQVIPQIKELLREQDDPWTGRMGEELDPVAEAAGLILEAINPEAPGDLTSGNIIKSGYDPEVDSLRQTAHAGKGWLLEYEEQQKRETGIKSLRVSYNRVFGYYIEVTRPNLALVPAAYQRKQTLANAERFITDELKDWEDRILGARERLKNLEQEIFQAIREKVKGYTTRIQKTSDLLGRLDALQSLAEAAYQYHYICPEMVPGPLVIQIEGGRHPMVEQALGPNLFVPNDTDLGPGLRMAIITGPNMAGKSTYLRQVALICLLAQVGSFVPASSARLGIARQVFTRIGASDNLSAGQSTFMVEMTEVSHILRHASPQSLVIMDEVGRGTSTYDGLSIAQAVAEYLLQKEQECPLTLMATHYHQLTKMVEDYPLAANYTVAVKEYGNRLVFLYQIIPGASDRSYGIQVARLAGLPEEVLARAASLVRKMELEDKHSTAEKESAVALDTLTGAKEEKAGDRGKGERVLQLLKTVDPQQTTPLEALSILYQLKELADTGSQSGGDQDG